MQEIFNRYLKSAYRIEVIFKNGDYLQVSLQSFVVLEVLSTRLNQRKQKLMYTICISAVFIELSARKSLVVADLVGVFFIFPVHLSVLLRSLHILTVQQSLKILDVRY
jgi:hypothetical protein